jgi:Uma2 family endonuclease
VTAVRKPRHHHSFAEYAHLCEQSTVKLEFWGGQIYAMAGGSIEHSRLSARLVSLFDQRRPRGCVALESNVRIRPLASDRATYADAVLVCGNHEPHPDDPEKRTIANPGVVAEVLSDSTADDDKTDKFDHYTLAPSLSDYLLVWQDEQRVELRRSEGSEWSISTFGRGDRVDLSCGISFTVDELYAT